MHYAGRPQSDSATNAPARVDMRSDTVTRPTEGMRAAMAAADVGDDVYGDDPSVNALQEKAAKLLGKEAALFVSSGTQSNLCAMLAHCQRGEEILTGHDYHVFIDEAGGASVLGGIMFAPIQTAADGGLDPDAISRTVKPDDEHCAISRLLTLENSWHGQAISLDRINAAAKRGREHGLIVHMDGARLMNACVKLGVSPADMLAEVDSVSLCLSKGLGAPAGSVLA
ncbi:MAG: GntG family PLP-dependent aldolase, partial [Candidatus Puniceispirillaceae bacterium]